MLLLKRILMTSATHYDITTGMATRQLGDLLSFLQQYIYRSEIDLNLGQG